MNSQSLQKIRDVLLMLLAALVLFLVGVYAYAKLFDTPDLTYYPLPFPMVREVVYPGEVATAIARRCNSRKTVLTYKSSRQLKRENSTQPAVVLDGVQISAEPGCTTVSTRANVIPEDTQPGFYRFSGVALIPGLIDVHEVGWNTDVFEVIKKPSPVAVVAPVAPVLQITENNAVKIEVRPAKQAP